MILDPNEPPGVPQTPSQRRLERRALGVFALAAVVVIGWVAAPVGLGLFLGVLFAFMLRPLRAILSRWTQRPWAAQLISLVVAALALVVLVLGISVVLITRGAVLG